MSVPIEGEVDSLSVRLGKTAQGTLELRLFKNNLTILDSTVLADFTQCDFTGYAAKTLAGASWTITPGTPDAGSGEVPSYATYPVQTFTSTAVQTQTIYGWYIVNTTSGKVIWAQKVSASHTLAYNGDNFTVTPLITWKL